MSNMSRGEKMMTSLLVLANYIFYSTYNSMVGMKRIGRQTRMRREELRAQNAQHSKDM